MIAALLALSLAGATPSSAEVDKAKELYRAGSEAYRRGRYDVAIQAFEGAKAITPAPPVLFALGQAYRLRYFAGEAVEDLSRAVDNYRAYLGAVGAGGRRDLATQHLAGLGPILERRRRSADTLADAPAEKRPSVLIVYADVEGARAVVDGSDPQETPATFEVEPGPHTVRVEADEYQTNEVRAVAVDGNAVPVQVPLTPQPGRLTVRGPDAATIALDGRHVGRGELADTPVAPGQYILTVTQNGSEPFIQTLRVARATPVTVEADLQTSRQRYAAYGMFGAGGLAVAGAGLALGLALNKQSDAQAIEDLATTRALTRQEAEDHGELVSERNDLGRIAGITAGVGAAAAVTGLLLYLFDDPTPADTSTRISPVVTSGGGGVSLTW